MGGLGEGADKSLAHVIRMCDAFFVAKMIHVRNVSDRLHRELTRRARASGESLTEYIEGILEREVARPIPRDVFDRIARRGRVNLGEPAADLIKKEREAREAS